MPTGYTSGIEDGMTFKDFVLRCAHAFGACVTLIDDGISAEIPEFKPSDYNLKEYENAKKELADFKCLTNDTLSAMREKEYQEEMKSYGVRIVKNNRLYDAYSNMLEMVKEWEPPTKDHVNLKKFMIKQLEGSIQFDICEPTKPVIDNRPIEVWRGEKIKELEKQIEYHKNENAKEIERVTGRNKWVKELKESLNILSA